jgi:type III pantothenate kinase
MGEAEATVGRVKSDWVLIDIGNTHVKTGTFLAGKLDSVQLRPTRDPSQHFLAAIPPGLTQTAVASVNPTVLNLVTEAASSVGLDVKVVLTSDGSIFRSGIVTSDVKTPETTGVDRVLGCLGAILDASGRSVVVVDCGTATTVNVMTADRCFRGGMIAPGRRLLSQSLKRGTASLPEIMPDAIRIEIGRSTQQSMNAGVAAAFIGGIRESVSAALKEFPEGRVFLTGGDAEFAHRVFPDFTRVHWLTLNGLHWYASNVGQSL